MPKNNSFPREAPGAFRVARAVGWVTFLEILRDKVLYNIVLCAVFLLGVGFFASKLNILNPERVVLDFGLSALYLSSTVIAIFMGSSLLGREFDRRTIYVALCHPISRRQFVHGKFLGIFGILTVNWILLVISYLTILFVSGDSGSNPLTMTLIAALFLAWIQSGLVASVALFFSSFSTTSLAAMMSIGIYFVGNNISQLRALAGQVKSPLGSGILNAFSFVCPNLEYFNLGLKVTYGLPVSFSYVCLSFFYGLLVVVFLLFFSGVLIQKREV